MPSGALAGSCSVANPEAYLSAACVRQKRLQITSSHDNVSQMANNVVVLDSIFYALADPTRRAVLQRLGRGSATVSVLAEPFDMAFPSFMKHIGVLERTGLIRSRKIGRIRTCMLVRKNLAAAERWLGEQRAIWTGRYQNLDNLLQRLTGENNDT
jgi:DNA-binding transcriptional ArsR family regulator